MPFIRGRYYMNPLYGAAVERSRSDPDVLPDEGLAPSGPDVELLSGQKVLQQAHSKTPPRTQEHKARWVTVKLQAWCLKSCRTPLRTPTCMIDVRGTGTRPAISRKLAQTSWMFPNGTLSYIGQSLARMLSLKLLGMIICMRRLVAQVRCLGTISSSGNRA